MPTDFSEITLVRPARAFRENQPTHLTDYAPVTIKVGQRGCIAIKRDVEGGFDVFGVSDQRYWVAASNILWGVKA
jgi:hypothetical protein